MKYEEKPVLLIYSSVFKKKNNYFAKSLYFF
jgi:hypothetical protein